MHVRCVAGFLQLLLLIFLYSSFNFWGVYFRTLVSDIRILQVNVVSYKTRPTAKDFIQVEIVVEKNTQKIILIGKVSTVFENILHHCFGT